MILEFLVKKERNANYYTKSLKSKRNSKSRSSGGRASISGGTTSRVSHSEIDNVNCNLDFFKSVVVTNENMNTIKQKLMSTAKARAKMIKDAKFDYLENYPIFFTHPSLVILIKQIFVI